MPGTKRTPVFGDFFLKRKPQGIAKCDWQDAVLLSADKRFWEERGLRWHFGRLLGVWASVS